MRATGEKEGLVRKFKGDIDKIRQFRGDLKV